VFFDLRGREWNGKILSNLNAWKVEGSSLSSGNISSANSTMNEPVFTTNDDSFAGMGEPMQFDNDLPF